METQRRRALLAALPYSLLAVVIVLIAIARPENDLTRFFLPAGDLLLDGRSPYILSQPEAGQPFIYPPFSLWVFTLLASLPADIAYLLMLAINGVLLGIVAHRLNISRWWCLYAPGLFVALAGQLDVVVFWLGLEAIQLQRKRLSALLLLIGFVIKPQVALFWLLPWWHSFEDRRERTYSLMIGAGVGVVAVLLWIVLQPAYSIHLFGEWWASLRAGSGAYIGDSPSFWSVGFLPGAVVALLLWIVFGHNHQLSRPLLALGLPALRYYSSYALVGAAPTWGIALGYATGGLSLMLALPLFWLEPLIIALYRLSQVRVLNGFRESLQR